MKKSAFLIPVLLFGLFLAFVSGCDPVPEESCEQDVICEGKSVTACCTDTECYYEYNGVRYSDDAESLSRLASALGCTQASAPSFKEDIDNIVLRLEALGEIARTNTQ